MKLWTLRNIVTAIHYSYRRAAHSDLRCIMGSPVHPLLHCPRLACVRTVHGLWCKKHAPNFNPKRMDGPGGEPVGFIDFDAAGVVPVGDLIDHVDGDDCICGPRVEMVSGGRIVIHEALDGRE